MTPVLFADSNVLIEALLIPQSAAYIVVEMVARGAFYLATGQICIEDTEDAIVSKLKNKPDELDETIASWEKLKAETRLIVLPDADPAFVKATWDRYLGVMRHKADIPVLAIALSIKPQPQVILSGNRDHFNPKVEERCGIKICSCQEFIEFIAEGP
jgi:predicted nucleic acid-binding protein